MHVSSASEKISVQSAHFLYLSWLWTFPDPRVRLTLRGEGRPVPRGLWLEDSGTLKRTSWSISAVCHNDVIMMTNENEEEGQQKAVPKCEVAFPVKSQSIIRHNSKLWRASVRASEEEKKDKGGYDLCLWFDLAHFSVVSTICHCAGDSLFHQEGPIEIKWSPLPGNSFIYPSLKFESLFLDSNLLTFA